jgi:hypothetical protein
VGIIQTQRIRWIDNGAQPSTFATDTRAVLKNWRKYGVKALIYAELLRIIA